jgi:hypothetical protein
MLLCTLSIYMLWGCGRSESSVTVQSLSRRGEQNKPLMIPSHWLPIPITLTSHGGYISISIRVGSLRVKSGHYPFPRLMMSDPSLHCNRRSSPRCSARERVGVPVRPLDRAHAPYIHACSQTPPASLAYAHGLLLVCATARPSSNHREAAVRHPLYTWFDQSPVTAYGLARLVRRLANY